MAQGALEFSPGIASGGHISEEQYLLRRDQCTAEQLKACVGDHHKTAWQLSPNATRWLVYNRGSHYTGRVARNTPAFGHHALAEIAF